MKKEHYLKFNFYVHHHWRADTWMPSNLYLLYFDYYSQRFLDIGVSGASDVLNENFKHLTLPLCHQNLAVVSEPD